MCARRFRIVLLILSVTFLTVACQPAQVLSAPLDMPAVMPIIAFEVTPASTSTPVLQSESGVRLVANISPTCIEAPQLDAQCVQPYAGEFMVTELNGAVVTSVMTNHEGQATVDLPPGKYILGVRTEDIYPLAAPIKVNVLAGRYVHISFSLDSGIRQQVQSK
jgi:hypothetical protein